MSAPVPRHLRNPRRGYTEDGHEIRPVTIGSDRRDGANSVSIHCDDCGHKLNITTDGLPAGWAIPDLPMLLALKCRCGSRRIGVMCDMLAHYAMIHAGGRGGGSPLPASYEVVPWQSVVGATRRVQIEGADMKRPPRPKPERLD